MLSLIIVAFHSAPKIAITTATQVTVQRFIKAPGGTTVATTQTSMVCTSMERPVLKECRGISGNLPIILSRDPR